MFKESEKCRDKGVPTMVYRAIGIKIKNRYGRLSLKNLFSSKPANKIITHNVIIQYITATSKTGFYNQFI